METKILAIWGAPSSGKTVFSVKLAQYMATRKENVTLVLCDITAPPLPLIVAPSELENESSLGNILTAPIINEQVVLQNCMTMKKCEYIALMGFLKRENAAQYKAHFWNSEYSKIFTENFINQLRNLGGTVILDCSSIIVYDALSLSALELADKVLRLISCDLKSISYFSSQLPLLEESKYHPERHIKCASSVKSTQAVEHIGAVLKGVPYTLPYCPEIEEQFINGDLFSELKTKTGRKYAKMIAKLAGEMLAE